MSTFIKYDQDLWFVHDNLNQANYRMPASNVKKDIDYGDDDSYVQTYQQVPGQIKLSSYIYRGRTKHHNNRR